MALVKGTNCGFVTAAPTADPAGGNTGVDGYVKALLDTAPAGAVRVTEIGWWCDTASEEGNFEVGLYTDNADNPANLVAGASQTNAKGTSAGWKKATGLNITITAETKYWIAAQCDDVTTTTYTNAAASAPDLYAYKGAATLPSPWGSVATLAYLLAVYAVYETAVGGVLTDPGMTGGMDDLDGGTS